MDHENAITIALLKQLIGDLRVDQCVAFQQRKTRLQKT
jgi:hypothetical protein